VNGVYTLADPTEIDNSQSSHKYGSGEHKGTTFNSDIDSIRMPPSLTLSKIRSLKQQILMIRLKSDLVISTIALASVYFERLCLDCRVDKSNRQISFAACLLLAYKTNEPNVAVRQKPKETKKGNATNTSSFYPSSEEEYWGILLTFRQSDKSFFLILEEFNGSRVGSVRCAGVQATCQAVSGSVPL
jgi:hypothetical protein